MAAARLRNRPSGWINEEMAATSAAMAAAGVGHRANRSQITRRT